jgi:hypothetical protein
MEFLSECWESVYSYWANNPLATIVQIVTAIPYGFAFWKERKEPLLHLVAISCFGFAVGYALLSAYSGIVIAVGTFLATFIGIRFGKRKIVSDKARWLCFSSLVALTIVVSLLIEQIPMMWLILVAGFLDYFAYIICKEYDKSMHIILILSQITLVIYEVIFSLYFFALLDLITACVITLHLWKKVRRKSNIAV